MLADVLDAATAYPDDGDATRALAAAMDVDPARLLLTNGGAEAIALVARRHPTGWAERFEFSLYRHHLETVEPHAPVWRSDPHNPTGRLLGPTVHSAVRDEAFYLLATGRWTRGDEHTTVVGSLTKAWAVPGLRIGYVLAPSGEDIDILRSLRPAWSVNGLVCAALPRLLDLGDPVAWRDGIASLRSELDELLRRHDLGPEPSDANFVWVPDAAGLRERLLPHGILVRDGASFGYPDAVRIAVPGPDGLERLERALTTPRPTDHT